MQLFASGARLLPAHHVTIRVPWHDAGWNGTVCTDPLANTSCLILPRIGENKQDAREAQSAGKRLDELELEALPPCVNEHVSFMAPFPFTRTITHPYTDIFPDTHGHFAPTKFSQPPFSVACVPFRWMLREEVEGDAKKNKIGLAERLQLGYEPDREPAIRDRGGKEFETNWIQERENQLALLTGC